MYNLDSLMTRTESLDATVTTVFRTISEINTETGVTIIIMEQRVREVLYICKRVYSMRLGKEDSKVLRRNVKKTRRCLNNCVYNNVQIIIRGEQSHATDGASRRR